MLPVECIKRWRGAFVIGEVLRLNKNEGIVRKKSCSFLPPKNINSCTTPRHQEIPTLKFLWKELRYLRIVFISNSWLLLSFMRAIKMEQFVFSKTVVPSSSEYLTWSRNSSIPLGAVLTVLPLPLDSMEETLAGPRRSGTSRGLTRPPEGFGFGPRQRMDWDRISFDPGAALGRRRSRNSPTSASFLFSTRFNVFA